MHDFAHADYREQCVVIQGYRPQYRHMRTIYESDFDFHAIEGEEV